jgi:hypothetical protein
MHRSVVAGAIALALTGSNASAAIIATEILPISIALSDIQQNLTGSTYQLLTFSGKQQFTVPRVDPSQNLGAITAALSFHIDFSYATSVIGGTSFQGIYIRPSQVAVKAYAGPAAAGSPLLGSGQQDLLNAAICTVQADASPCFALQSGDIDRTDLRIIGTASILDLFEGTGDADITVEFRFQSELFYDSVAGDGATFGYAFDFKATGSLALTFEGEGVESVPAPAGAGLLGLGLVALATARRRRVSAASAS